MNTFTLLQILHQNLLYCQGKALTSFQRLSSPCWIAVDPNGIILCGHCKCMAGLGEVCSHIGAIMFILEAWGRKVTDENITVRFNI